MNFTFENIAKYFNPIETCREKLKTLKLKMVSPEAIEKSCSNESNSKILNLLNPIPRIKLIWRDANGKIEVTCPKKCIKQRYMIALIDPLLDINTLFGKKYEKNKGYIKKHIIVIEQDVKNYGSNGIEEGKNINTYPGTFIDSNEITSHKAYNTNCFSHSVSHLINIPKGYFLHSESLEIILKQFFKLKHHYKGAKINHSNLENADVIVMRKNKEPVHSFKIIKHNGEIFANTDNGRMYELVTSLKSVEEQYKGYYDSISVYRYKK